MPPKMSDRVDALEEKLETLEESLRLRMEEFQKMVMEEFAKLRSSPETSSPLSDEASSEFKMAVKKVELPMFDGDDPVGWVTRAETYFEVQGSSEEVKVRLAKVCMEGATIHWFNLLRETEDNLTWTKLKQALIERYGGRKSDNPFEELKDLQQVGDVEEYISEFEYISSQVMRLPEDQYLGYFLGGLKPEIRLKVRTLNPRSRLQAMKIARDVETELRGSLNYRGSGGRKIVHGSGGKSGSGSAFNPGSSGGFQRSGPASQNTFRPAQSGTNSQSVTSPNLVQKGRDDAGRGVGFRNRGTRHLPYSELMDRKAKGLCFRCGERFHPLHQCAEKHLRLLILGDDEKINEEGEVIAIEVQEDEEEVAVECNALGLIELTGMVKTVKCFTV